MIKQNKSQRELKTFPKCFPSSQFESQPVQVVDTFSNQYKSVLNVVYQQAIKTPLVFLKQKTIAKRAGVSRKTVNLALQRFHEWGILYKNIDEFWGPRVLVLADMMFSSPMRLMMSRIARGLTFVFSMHLLASTSWSWRPLDQCPEGGVTHISNLGLKKNIYINQSIVSLTSCVDEYEQRIDRLRMKLKEMKQIERDELKANPIPPYIKDVTDTLQLTKWGQISLIAYPEGAIEYAKKALRHSYGIRNKYKFFSSKCNEYCKQNEIQPEWVKVNFVNEALNKPENALMTYEKDTPQEPKPQAPKTGKTTPVYPKYDPNKPLDEITTKHKADGKSRHEEWRTSKTPEELAKIEKEWSFPMPGSQNHSDSLKVEITTTTPESAPAQDEPTGEPIGDDQWFDGTPINYDFVDEQIDEWQ